MLVDPQTQARLAEHHPAAANELISLQATLQDSSLDADLLKLCQAYFAAEVAGHPWAATRALSDREAACIAVCEQFLVSVSSMNDEHIAALAGHFSTDEIYNLLYALYLIEASERLKVTLAGVLQ